MALPVGLRAHRLPGRTRLMELAGFICFMLGVAVTLGFIELFKED